MGIRKVLERCTEVNLILFLLRMGKFCINMKLKYGIYKKIYNEGDNYISNLFDCYENEKLLLLLLLVIEGDVKAGIRYSRICFHA